MVKSAQSIVHPVLKIRVSNDFFGRDEMIIGGRSQESNLPGTAGGPNSSAPRLLHGGGAHYSYFQPFTTYLNALFYC